MAEATFDGLSKDCIGIKVLHDHDVGISSLWRNWESSRLVSCYGTSKVLGRGDDSVCVGVAVLGWYRVSRSGLHSLIPLWCTFHRVVWWIVRLARSVGGVQLWFESTLVGVGGPVRQDNVINHLLLMALIRVSQWEHTEWHTGMMSFLLLYGFDIHQRHDDCFWCILLGCRC